MRATDLQAFIGLRVIDRLDEYVEKRNENFFLYNNSIHNTKLKLRIDNNCFISNFAMPVVCENRNDVVKKLLNNNIEVRPLIAGNMGNKPMWYEKYGKVELPNANLIDKLGFYLPNHQDLNYNDIDKISDIING
jgi:CDP-6-deoxy-D-xylo-4-hexulose-3-dehydrase